MMFKNSMLAEYELLRMEVKARTAEIQQWDIGGAGPIDFAERLLPL